jgi:hypothetical protein
MRPPYFLYRSQDPARCPVRCRRPLLRAWGAVRAGLFIVGAAFELLGIVLIGSPDLVPLQRRVTAAIRSGASRATWWLLRHFGRRRHVVGAGSGVIAVAGMSARGIVGIREDASLEEKVAFLLRREKITQNRISDLTEGLSSLREQLHERAGELQATMEEHVAAELDAVRREYRDARVAGIALLTLGLVCVTLANFV